MPAKVAILQPLVTALTKVVGPLLAASALAAQEVPARASRRISSRHDVNRLERIVSRLVRLLDSMVLMVLMVVLSIPVKRFTGTECRKFARWNSAHRR